VAQEWESAAKPYCPLSKHLLRVLACPPEEWVLAYSPEERVLACPPEMQVLACPPGKQVLA